MRRKIINQLKLLKNKSHVKQEIVGRFLKLISTQKKLTRQEGAQKHICAFFLPVNPKTRSIYLVHHIKADDWIPPGGHIDKNELPVQTVKREFKEELDHKLTDERIDIFDLSIKEINRPHHRCLTHYDIWYLVYIKKLPFNFTRKEFHRAGWFSLTDAINKIKLKNYRNIVKKLRYVL